MSAIQGGQTEGSDALTTPKYDQLPSKGDHFRLLHLRSGDGSSPLDCRLEIHAIGGPETPSYTALSYCWRNPEYDSLAGAGGQNPSAPVPSHFLRCNGQKISIATELNDALLRLRDETQTVRLWVDALCINQSDLAERATQVLLMQRIYHTASKVCMWIGMEHNLTGAAFALLKKLEVLERHDFDRGPTMPPAAQQLYDAGAMQRLGLPAIPSDEWAQLVRLFKRPYFRRIWIVQEMIAAPLTSSIYCGDMAPLPWTVLIKAVSTLERAGWVAPIDSYYGGENNFSFLLIALSISMAWMKGAESPADRLVIRRKTQQTRRFEASDPRDKVFALIGIINDFGHRDLFGEDSPEGQGGPQTVTKDGTVHATFKLDERGKSADDIAIEILQTHTDKTIQALRTAVMDTFDGCVKLADVILHPNNDYTTQEFLDRHAVVTKKTVSGIEYISKFKTDHRGKSRDHQRAGDWASKALNMFMGGISSYSLLIGEYCESDMFVEICNMPDIKEEVTRFREATSWLLECLEAKPKSEQKQSDNPIDLTPLVIGDRERLDSLEYSVKSERQYPDWAWSTKGWTMPMYEVPVEQIYADYTVKCIQDDGDLDVLGQVEDASTRKLTGLPSWVPDLSAALTRTPIATWKARQNAGFYSAAGSSKAEPRWTSTDGISLLQLSGFEIDEISQLASEESAAPRITGQPQEWAAMIENLPPTDPSGCPVSEALWRTLIGDRSASDHFPAPPDYAGHYDTMRMMQRLNRDLDARIAAGEAGTPALLQLYTENGIDLMDSQRLMAEAGLFQSGMASVMLERRLFVTKEGYIGAGPVSSRPGDLVFVLAGGHSPFVLRREPEPADGAKFRLVGDCYVHGWMKGEALDWDDFAWEDISLV